MTPRYTFVVMTSPVSPERDEEFNQWYDDVHLKDVLMVPGIVSARRLKLSGDQIVEGAAVRLSAEDAASAVAQGYPYLALYEIESDDPFTVLSEIQARSEDGRFEFTEAIDMAAMPPKTALYVALNSGH